MVVVTIEYGDRIYLGPAEKVSIIQFKGCYWFGKSFKKQAIENGRVKSASIAKEEY